MAGNFEQAERRPGSRWRIAGWGVAAFVLLMPFLAMQVTEEVNWGAGDFVFAGIMLAVTGGTIEMAARKSGDRAYRGGAIVAVAAAFLLVWVNAAVGFLGDEGNPANLMFVGVIAVAILGSIIARFRPAGLAKAIFATAAAQLIVGMVALVAGLGSEGQHGVYEVVMGTSLFTALWLGSAFLFRKAASKQVGTFGRP